MENTNLSCLLFVGYFFTLVSCRNFPVPPDYVDRDWFSAAQQELSDALTNTPNTNVAENIILFLGDGMGPTDVWASRLYAGQYKHGQSGEEFQLNFEKFPHTGISKTYNVDRMSPDSAGTATAYLSGVKAKASTIGVNHRVEQKNCSTQTANTVDSIMDWAAAAGKWTGIVSTARVTHASIAANYAHAVNRKWESDTDVNKDPDTENCKDIARQLVEDNPNIRLAPYGKLQVVMGGGRQNFRSSEYFDEEYGTPGKRSDQRDLIQEWMDEKQREGVSYRYVWNSTSLDAVDPDTTDYLLGLFDPAHMDYEFNRDPERDPSIIDMTRKAISILKRSYNGFYLFVEGSNIDYGHHANEAKAALEETWMFDQAVRVAMEMTDEADTLIVVTADHSHTFVTNGNPSRGRDVLGTADNEQMMPALDELPYTILAYGNGPGGPINMQYRANISQDDTTANNYTQQALVPTEFETHGSEDVGIYARGPLAHLFSGVHEQNYIPHVMAYAACVGDNKAHCNVTSGAASRNIGFGVNMAMLTISVAVVLSNDYLLNYI